jgi:hypothetical protein
MKMQPGPGEPLGGPWREVTAEQLVAQVFGGSEQSAGTPVVVAVDGRSGGGKSTFAERLVAAVPRSALVSIDDVAWHAPMFGWTDQLAEGRALASSARRAGSLPAARLGRPRPTRSYRGCRCYRPGR